MFWALGHMATIDSEFQWAALEIFLAFPVCIQFGPIPGWRAGHRAGDTDV